MSSPVVPMRLSGCGVPVRLPGCAVPVRLPGCAVPVRLPVGTVAFVGAVVCALD
jgi:hypothetical protein